MMPWRFLLVGATVGALSVYGIHAQQGGVRNQGAAAGQLTVEDVLLAADRLRTDRWYPEETAIGDDHGGRLSRAADMDILVLAARHPSPDLRYIAVREFGRFETPANVAFLAAFLDDPNATVRVAASEALVQSLVDRPEATTEAAMAIAALEERLKREVLSPDRAYLWYRLAELPLPVPTALKYEREWIDEIQHMKPLRQPAATALLRMFRTQAREPGAGSANAVEAWARAGLSQGSVSVLVGNLARGDTATFLEMLQAMRADNDEIAVEAAQFTCRIDVKESIEQCSAPIREIGIQLLNPNNPRHLPALQQAARNRLHEVGAVTAIRKLINAPDMPFCTLLEIAKGLPVEREVMAALEKVTPQRYELCDDWDPSRHLMAEMQPLLTSTTGPSWVVPATAYETLARRLAAGRQKDDVREAIMRVHTEIGVPHLRWEVRAVAARVAAVLEDAASLTRLVADKHPNVRAEALRGLTALRSPLVWPAALDALQSPDAHLIITAVNALKGIPQPPAAIEPLLMTLERLTKEQRDTSRRARIALVERIAEFTTPGTPDASITSNRLQPILRDVDPAVAVAAAKAVEKITLTPTIAHPTRRAGRQPNVAQLMAIPPCISIKFDDSPHDSVVLLDRLVAPLAIARLTELINDGYYNNTVMHFQDEHIGIGGSPAANDEGGLDRVIRDEVGSRDGGAQLVLIGHERDHADGRLGIRRRPSAARHRRETVLGGFLRVSGGHKGATMSRVWVGAPEVYRRGACNPNYFGIPPITRQPAASGPSPSMRAAGLPPHRPR